MTTTEKKCRHCGEAIAVTASTCPHCGRKQTGGAAFAVILGLLLLAIVGVVVADRLYPAGADTPSTLDAESSRRLAEVEALHDRVTAMGAARELPALASREPGVFAGVNLLCGRLLVPNGRYDRVIIAHGEAIHDSPMEGEWFDHVWRRAACD